ncbi:hypothetical protein M413DRAFT_440311 [Hebeloma cylindrosporum]|uniref:F-box domain-containing protein n=1 Tax=Hebeloma cylindrosporum TaxID=76867 RepID=A0A0C3CD72_HEBCY|nr:hypothetical protein M413DRAFT_440311 [Hebeloma cylindrosporum h7]
MLILPGHTEFTIHHIPDDVWIIIFENIESPAQVAILARTCNRFKSLAARPLLNHVRWLKAEPTKRNLQAWTGVYQNVLALPRKLTLGIPLDFNTSRHLEEYMNTPDAKFHDEIFKQIPKFTSIRELVFDGTVLSPFTYITIALIPTLRSLTISNCKFSRLPTLFGDYPNYKATNDVSTPFSFPYATLPITHFSLHKNEITTESAYNSAHPLNIVTAPNLTSLSMTWTVGLQTNYAPKRWVLPSLEDLEVFMPLLSRDLVDSLVSFAANCPLVPRIKLSIERHNLSDQQLSAVQFPLRGVWNYNGPLPIASFHSDRPRLENQLTHVMMNEALTLSPLVDGLEKLPEGLRELEVLVRKWDVELLFAIRKLFPRIQKLLIRYGRGVFPADFFVTLGADILPDLPHLHTFKIIQDLACVPTTRSLASMLQIPPPNVNNGFPGAPAVTGPIAFPFEEIDTDPPCTASPDAPALEEGDLRDYLIGWNRYCKNLRCVQLNKEVVWERRFAGDKWVESVVEVPVPKDFIVRGVFQS